MTASEISSESAQTLKHAVFNPTVLITRISCNYGMFTIIPNSLGDTLVKTSTSNAKLSIKPTRTHLLIGK